MNYKRAVLEKQGGMKFNQAVLRVLGDCYEIEAQELFMRVSWRHFHKNKDYGSHFMKTKNTVHCPLTNVHRPMSDVQCLCYTYMCVLLSVDCTVYITLRMDVLESDVRSLMKETKTLFFPAHHKHKCPMSSSLADTH